jgi:hypothetical protein
MKEKQSIGKSKDNGWEMYIVIPNGEGDTLSSLFNIIRNNEMDVPK